MAYGTFPIKNFVLKNPNDAVVYQEIWDKLVLENKIDPKSDLVTSATILELVKCTYKEFNLEGSSKGTLIRLFRAKLLETLSSKNSRKKSTSYYTSWNGMSPRPLETLLKAEATRFILRLPSETDEELETRISQIRKNHKQLKNARALVAHSKDLLTLQKELDAVKADINLYEDMSDSIYSEEYGLELKYKELTGMDEAYLLEGLVSQGGLHLYEAGRNLEQILNTFSKPKYKNNTLTGEEVQGTEELLQATKGLNKIFKKRIKETIRVQNLTVTQEDIIKVVPGAKKVYERHAQQAEALKKLNEEKTRLLKEIKDFKKANVPIISGLLGNNDAMGL